MNRSAYVLAGAAAIGLVAALLYLLQGGGGSSPSPAVVSPPLAQVPSAPAPTPPESKVHYPLDARLSEPPLAKAFDLQAELSDLLGLKTVQSMFRLDDFPRRLVATVDNLGRAHTPPTLWPVNPTSGRFTVEERDNATFIGADNGLRYTPYVLLLETVDLHRAVTVYARIYPTLQQAYQDLGYPKAYFNDRLIQVIDELLATPETDAPLQVQLPPINGPVRPVRPWVLYQFADPTMESLSAGQKILLRMGSINERRIKARLGEVRRLLTAPGPKR